MCDEERGAADFNFSRSRVKKLKSGANGRLLTPRQMDKEIKTKRTKKSDKAKEKYERNGGFSQKHVRLTEALAAKMSHAPRK
jgi:hypothetical protein